MREVERIYDIVIKFWYRCNFTSIFITQYICDNSKNLSRSYYLLVGRGRTYIFLLANIIYHVLLKDCSRLLVTYRTLSRKFENVSVRLLTRLRFISFCGDHTLLRRERSHSRTDARDFRVNQLKHVRFDGGTPGN